MCPSAERLVESDARVNVVPLAFHVDYFDRPWMDPYSDASYSRREWEYSRLYDRTHRVGKPDYQYFTPMLMVDGRTPMPASSSQADTARAREAIGRAARTAPGARVELAWEGAGDGERTLRIDVTATSDANDGGERLIAAALVEDPITTDVKSGELAGKTYRGRHAVRVLKVESATATRGKTTRVRVPLRLPSGGDPGRFRAVAFVQDEGTGAIDQAATLPWKAETVSVPKRR